ncbi:MAG: hypothetical protein ACLFVO_10695 [Chloroflexaceae bacterium]
MPGSAGGPGQREQWLEVAAATREAEEEAHGAILIFSPARCYTDTAC